MVKVEFDTASKSDLESMQKAFKDMLGAVDTILNDPAKTLRNQALGNTPWKTGALKKSWSPLQKHAQGLSFQTDKPYAMVIEEGLYKGVGPRTIQMSKGIFSRQAPEGMLEPLMTEENIRRVTDAILRHFELIIGRA